MAGLLEKAVQLNRESALKSDAEEHNGSKKESAPDTGGVSAEEHKQLVAEIDNLFVSRSLITSIEPEQKQNRKTGMEFLVVVNILAGIILGAAVLIFGFFQRSSAEDRAENGGTQGTTQGLILEEMKKKTAEELQAKESRIAAIRRELENMRRAGVSSPSSAAALPDPRRLELERELTALQSDAATQLRRMADQKDRQAFMLRQLQSLYQNVGRQIGSGAFPEALETITAAEKFIESESEISVVAPAVRPVNALLRKLVTAEQASARTAAVAGIAGTVSEISRLVSQADSAYQAGNTREAEEIYSRAVNSLDSVSRAYNRLTSIIKKDHEAETAKLGTEIASLKGSLSTLQTLSRSQESELAQSQTEREALEQKAASQARIIEEKEEDISRLVTTVKSGIESLSVRAQTIQGGMPSVPPQVQVADLLTTKIALREVAGSEKIRTEHPELYQNFDRFFEEYADLYSQMGRERAARDLVSAVNDVIGTLESAIPPKQ